MIGQSLHYNGKSWAVLEDRGWFWLATHAGLVTGIRKGREMKSAPVPEEPVRKTDLQSYSGNRLAKLGGDYSKCEEVRAMVENGVGVLDACNLVDLDRNAYYAWRHMFGIQSHCKIHRRDDCAKIAASIMAGKRPHLLLKEYKMSRDTLTNYVRREFGCTPHQLMKRGQD